MNLFLKMRRYRTSGGAIASQLSYRGNLARLNPNRQANTNPSNFYTARESNITGISENLLTLIKNYLQIPNSQNAGRGAATTYDQLVMDLSDYGRDTLRESFGINDDAPTAFNPYLPTFVVYDFLNIQANIVPKPSDSDKFLRIAGMIRTILSTMDADNFGKWNEYYRDFKNGRYSGGKAKWRARKAADTPYDPVDPVFDFDSEPRVKIPRVNRSTLATGNALYYLDVLPPTKTALDTGLTNIIKGGPSRRAARSSRRRY